jgi:type II secretory pathway pseudopilin PulG
MRSLLEHPLVIVIITVVAGIFMFSLYVSSNRGRSGEETLSSLEQSVTNQQERVRTLEEQAQLSKDPFVQEKIQRDERLLQKPGEIVLQLPPLTVASPTPEPKPTPDTPWQEWKQLLFASD